jgi:hypothetical protein
MMRFFPRPTDPAAPMNSAVPGDVTEGLARSDLPLERRSREVREPLRLFDLEPQWPVLRIALKALYLRLRSECKLPKMALPAAMRKLLTVLNAIFKHHTTRTLNAAPSSLDFQHSRSLPQSPRTVQLVLTGNNVSDRTAPVLVTDAYGPNSTSARDDLRSLFAAHSTLVFASTWHDCSCAAS